MTPRFGPYPVGVVASLLCLDLIDGPERSLHRVHHGPCAAQFADDSGRVVVSIVVRSAVRLPRSIVLPDAAAVPMSASVGCGVVTVDHRPLPVARWFRPARPHTPRLRGRVDAYAVHALAHDLPELVGLGPGLTPYGDDVVCGAMVACHAVGVDAGPVRDALGRIDLDRRTTATSAHLLRAANDGWCVDVTGDYLHALDDAVVDNTVDSKANSNVDVAAARRDLLALGHTSGAGILNGIHRIIGPDPSSAAA